MKLDHLPQIPLNSEAANVQIDIPHDSGVDSISKPETVKIEIETDRPSKPAELKVVIGSEPVISPSATHRRARNFWRLFRGARSIVASPRFSPAQLPPWPIERLPPHQATCAICLSDYEHPSQASTTDDAAIGWEVLRKLKDCHHCFHQPCLDPWLKMSGRCPLCQVPVSTK